MSSRLEPLVPLFALLLPFTMTPSSSMSAAERPSPPAFAKATFGGGCFWCTEAVFESEPGVKSVVSGYAGGHVKDPTYRQISSGDTGHAEVIQIEYDPNVVSYERLLELFWDAHDPTTLNRQGADVGPQYRSIILAHDDTKNPRQPRKRDSKTKS
jgi:peptide-methionine (S)-S-oxide reductase